ncbi:MAG: minor capsid protein, partial [Cyanobacteria bacterium P01_G01_bin.49]
DSEWERIKEALLEAIKPQSERENPISRKELLAKINAILGDRAQKFKNRASTIARTELTFAYNAGRLDSYVRSGLVAGVKYQTIFDERRCQICASRQGIIVALDDIEGLAQLTIPAHPRCRCVWSPVLKTEFDIEGGKKQRQVKHRKLVPGKSWLSGAILAAILIPEELFYAGILAAGIKALVAKAGSIKLARAAIAQQINKIAQNSLAKPAAVLRDLIPKSRLNTPIFIAPGINLKNTNPQQLRSLIPGITDRQIYEITRKTKNRSTLKDFSDLQGILDKNQYRQLKAIARQNNLLNLLHPNNNYNPSLVWVNSGGIISKSKSKAIYNLIQKNNYNTVDELLAALKNNGIDADKLNVYAIDQFDQKYQP